MKKSHVIVLLVVASVMLVQQLMAQAAGQAAPSTQAAPSGQAAPAAQGQKKEIKNPAEYNAYVNAIQQQNPAQKAQLLEAFLQSYPSSVMKEDALELLMVAYQQSGDAQKTLDAAQRVLQTNPNNVRALALLAYNYRAAASSGGPQMADNLAKAKQYGQQGLQALQNMQKPSDMSQDDFVKLHNETGAIFDGAVGFAALQAKDYATAQNDFQQAVGWESQANIADIYPLATADLEAKPINPAGFWFIVKAAQLAQGGTQQTILDYGKKKYIRYHGSDQGWDQVVQSAQASSSVMPPAGFTVAAAPPPPSPAEQAADLVKSKSPTDMSFAEWELVLSSGNQQAADTVWNAIKDKAVKLGANVISATAGNVQLAGSDDDIEAKKADITLNMAKPITSHLMSEYVTVGTLMNFQGTIASYTPNPFMMTFNDGILLDKTGKPVATTPTVHHTTHHQ
jgi:tetratricopeptide (TPR) repeat protein